MRDLRRLRELLLRSEHPDADHPDAIAIAKLRSVFFGTVPPAPPAAPGATLDESALLPAWWRALSRWAGERVQACERVLRLDFGTPPPGTSRPAHAPLLTTLLTTALVALAALWVLEGIAGRKQWDRFRAALEHEPGLIITTAERRRDGFVVHGMRDPLARDPAELARDLMPRVRVDMRWEPFQSGDPVFVDRRARLLLDPPVTVRLQLQDGRLVATGEAPQAWLMQARRLAQGIAGVADYDDRGVVNTDRARVEALGMKLEGLYVVFEEGVTVAPAQESIVRDVISIIRDAHAAAHAAGIRVTFEVAGYADSNEAVANGRPSALGSSRADLIRRFLVERLPSGIALRGIDGTARLFERLSPGDVGLTRCVAFRLTLDEPDAR
jgi:hypothetical protein